MILIKDLKEVGLLDLGKVIDLYHEGFRDYSRFSDEKDHRKVLLDLFMDPKRQGLDLVAYDNSFPIGFIQSEKLSLRGLVGLSCFFPLRDFLYHEQIQSKLVSGESDCIDYKLEKKENEWFVNSSNLIFDGYLNDEEKKEGLCFDFKNDLIQFTDFYLNGYCREKFSFSLRFTPPTDSTLRYVTSSDYHKNTLVVRKEYRGRGIGRALNTELEQRLREKGVPQLFSLAIDDGSAGAYFLNQKIGYETLLKIPNWYVNGAGTALMGKSLSIGIKSYS